MFTKLLKITFYFKNKCSGINLINKLTNKEIELIAKLSNH